MSKVFTQCTKSHQCPKAYGSKAQHSVPDGSAVRVHLQFRRHRKDRFSPRSGKFPWRNSPLTILACPMDRRPGRPHTTLYEKFWKFQTQQRDWASMGHLPNLKFPNWIGLTDALGSVIHRNLAILDLEKKIVTTCFNLLFIEHWLHHRHVTLIVPCNSLTILCPEDMTYLLVVLCAEVKMKHPEILTQTLTQFWIPKPII